MLSYICNECIEDIPPGQYRYHGSSLLPLIRRLNYYPVFIYNYYGYPLLFCLLESIFDLIFDY